MTRPFCISSLLFCLAALGVTLYVPVEWHRSRVFSPTNTDFTIRYAFLFAWPVYTNTSDEDVPAPPEFGDTFGPTVKHTTYTIYYRHIRWLELGLNYLVAFIAAATLFFTLSLRHYARKPINA